MLHSGKLEICPPSALHKNKDVHNLNVDASKISSVYIVHSIVSTIDLIRKWKPYRIILVKEHRCNFEAINERKRSASGAKWCSSVERYLSQKRTKYLFFMKFPTTDNAILAFWMVHCIPVTSQYTCVWPYMEIDAANVTRHKHFCGKPIFVAMKMDKKRLLLLHFIAFCHFTINLQIR